MCEKNKRQLKEMVGENENLLHKLEVSAPALN